MEALFTFHSRKKIINSLFERYISPPASNPRKHQAHKVKVLALDIIVSILDVCDSLSQYEDYLSEIAHIQKWIYEENKFLDGMVAFCIDENRVHNINKLDLEELRLYAKAFAFLPLSFI